MLIVQLVIVTLSRNIPAIGGVMSVGNHNWHLSGN